MSFILKKKFLIKVPLNVSVFLKKKKKLFLIKGPLGSRYLKVNSDIIFLSQKHSVYLENRQKGFNKNKIFEGLIYQLKKFILEVSSVLTKKLKFLGLGYRFFLIDKSLDLLELRLGYSHKIFFKPPKLISIYCNKNTLLYLKSSNYNFLSEVSAFIRSYRMPEPYKGKGILYLNEKISLKKGKKI